MFIEIEPETRISSKQSGKPFGADTIARVDPDGVERKTCPICSERLKVGEFGVCRARKDNRNLYCMACIRKKVTDSRRALKEYRSARKRNVLAANQEPDDRSVSNMPLLSKLSPMEQVREAIKRGARTQKEIAQETRLGKDEIGDALANLLLWTREIKTVTVDNVRVYSMNESVRDDDKLQAEARSGVPPRKRDVPASFSALQGLMPGKKPKSNPEKIGGWVAA